MQIVNNLILHSELPMLWEQKQYKDSYKTQKMMVILIRWIEEYYYTMMTWFLFMTNQKPKRCHPVLILPIAVKVMYSVVRQFRESLRYLGSDATVFWYYLSLFRFCTRWCVSLGKIYVISQKAGIGFTEKKYIICSLFSIPGMFVLRIL